MDFLLATLQHPFTWGLALGLIFMGLVFRRLLEVQAEFSRYKKHLSDKLEVEARQMNHSKQERDALRQENENLRIKVAQLSQKPERKHQRDLQVLLRAEQKMLVGAPGFAAAWERAKDEAVAQMEEEESGFRKPRELLARIVAPFRSSDAASSNDGSGEESSRKLLGNS